VLPEYSLCRSSNISQSEDISQRKLIAVKLCCINCFQTKHASPTMIFKRHVIHGFWVDPRPSHLCDPVPAAGSHWMFPAFLRNGEDCMLIAVKLCCMFQETQKACDT
jgi:hypothetical protein